jgi:protein MPE1
MPVTARNTARAEPSSTNRLTTVPGQIINSSISELDNAQTEDEKIKALFNLQANQWKEQQQEMAK